MLKPISAVACAALMLGTLSACQPALRWEDGPRPAMRKGADQDPFPPSGHYRVRAGDTLYSIAFRHNLDYRELARWNGIGESYLIVPGQLLRLTPPSAGGPAAAGPPSRPPVREPTAPARGTPPAAEAPASRLAWQWPLQGAIVNRFNPPSSKGIDLAGEYGQPVLAAAAGRVVYSGEALKGYGQLIIIKHDDTWLTAYGYNKRRLVQEGDTVNAGDRIAEVGYGPGRQGMLHFEVRRRGRPVDPLTVLPLSAR